MQLIASVDASAPARSRGDARRLQQVLWNLRAQRHQVHAEAAAASRSTSHHVQGDLQITVTDNGQGISPTFLPHVFERFRQQDASSTRATSGLGLGLSIAKQLVELHGGTITASSPGDGQGSTFVVTVPALVPAQSSIPADGQGLDAAGEDDAIRISV